MGRSAKIILSAVALLLVSEWFWHCVSRVGCAADGVDAGESCGSHHSDTRGALHPGHGDGVAMVTETQSETDGYGAR